MALRVLTPPAAELVSAREVITQTHLRLEQDVDVELVELYIQAAREYAETATRRQFVTATYLLTLPCFPAGCIELPRPPLQSVSAVRYYDAAGALQTLDPATYYVDTDSLVGRILRAAGASWPATQQRPDAVQVEYVAGYGAPDEVPAGIRHAVLVRTADLYLNREKPESIGTVNALLAPYWVP